MKNTTEPPTPSPPTGESGGFSWQIIFLAACIGAVMLAILLKVLGVC
jgi:hypothetical protein